MSAPIVTPLTYHDALVMADEAMGDGTQSPIIVRARVAQALINVDVAARDQAADVLADREESGDLFVQSPKDGWRATL